MTESRILRWMVEQCARSLEIPLREAVLGDLAETRASDSEALRQIVDVMLRRQTALWHCWRPWAVLAVVATPLAILLSRRSSETASWSSIYVWLCANNLDRTLLADKGFWHVTLDSLTHVAVACLTLSVWSWASGCLLGWVAQRTAWSTWALFSLASCLSLLAIPWNAMSDSQAAAAALHENAIVATNLFYRFVYPLLIHATCVMAPSLLGVMHGRRLRWSPFPLIEATRTRLS